MDIFSHLDVTIHHANISHETIQKKHSDAITYSHDDIDECV